MPKPQNTWRWHSGYRLILKTTGKEMRLCGQMHIRKDARMWPL